MFEQKTGGDRVRKPQPNFTRRNGLALGCAFASLLAAEAQAVGFIVNPTSELTGIANAGAAIYDGSTAAISNNPAVLSLMSESQIGGNLSIIVPDWSVDEGWDCHAENNCTDGNLGRVTAVPAMGVIMPLPHNLTWGMGMGAIAGQGLDYGSDWKGRSIVTENTVEVVELMNSLSWRMNDQWTFGAGLGILYGRYEQEQDLPALSASAGDDLHSVYQFVGYAQDCRGLPPAAQAICLRGAVNESGLDPASAADTIGSIKNYLDGEPGTSVEHDGDDFAVEFVLGATWEITAGHRLGMAYHHLTDFKFDGNSRIKGQLLSDEANQNPNSSLTWNMPDRLVLSGSHRVGEKLELYWDVERVFFDTFESTDLRMDGYGVTRIDRNFKDANRYAVGAEYALNDKWTLQAGFSYDESPVDDEDRLADIPVDTIFKTAVGALYQWNDDLRIHGYLTVEDLGDGKVEQLASIDGHKVGESVNFDSDATMYVFGVSFNYKF